VVADALSRVEAVGTSVSPEALAEAQDTDAELNTLLQGATALRLEKIQVTGTDIALHCDTTTRPRPYVPATLRQQVFNSLHGLGHLGTRATAKLISQRYVWPGVQKDCRTWARGCQSCQRSKISRHTTTPLGDFALPTSRFQHMHIDIVGPLPTSDGFRYCLTAVDRFTRWPEAIPMQDIMAETVARALLSGWITRYGCPQTITTDQGRQFESQLFHALANTCGIHLSRMTAFHPAANGLVEWMHRTLKAAIMCRAQERWTEALPLVLLGMRTAFKEDLQVSVAELVYGEPLRIPGEFLVASPSTRDPSELITQLCHYFEQLRPVPAARHASPAVFVHNDLADSTHICLRQDAVRRPLDPPYSGLTGSCPARRRRCGSPSTTDLSRCQPTGLSPPTPWWTPKAVP